MTFQEWINKINGGQGFTQQEQQEYQRINNIFNSEETEKLKTNENVGFFEAFLRHLRNFGRIFGNHTNLTEQEYNQIVEESKEFNNLFAGEDNANRKFVMDIMSGEPQGFITMLETLNSRFDLDINVEQWKQDREYYERREQEQNQNRENNQQQADNGLPYYHPVDPNANFVWNDIRYQAMAYAPLVSNLVNTLPPKLRNYESDYVREDGEHKTIGDIFEESKDHDMALNEEEPAKNFYGYDARTGKIEGVSGSAATTIPDKYIKTKADANTAATMVQELSDAFQKAARSAKDPDVKQFYEDRAYITDVSKNNNYMQAMFTNPYLNGLINHVSLDMNYGVDDIKKQRKALGKPLSKSVNNFAHGVTNELKAQYLKQKYEKAGWTEETEKDYLDKLNKAHTELLKNYNNIKRYKDLGEMGYDPNVESRIRTLNGKVRNRTATAQDNADLAAYKKKLSPKSVREMNKAMPLSFGEIMGNKADSGRSIVGQMGYIRGEKQAIEHGWGANELAILGVVGSIDERVRNIEQFGTPEQKEGMDDFKSEFIKLKTEIMSDYVVTSKEKKQIADKVLGFMEKHAIDESPFASLAMRTANDMRSAFNNACGEINAQAEANAEIDKAIEEDRLKRPLEYIKGLENEARATGEYRKYVNEMIRIQAGMHRQRKGYVAVHDYPDEVYDEWIDYMSSVIKLSADPDANEMDEVSTETLQQNQKLVEQLAYTMQEIEITKNERTMQMAYDIRRGKIPVEEKYDSIKNDFRASYGLATDMQMEQGEELYDRSYGINAMKPAIDQAYDNQEDYNKFKDFFSSYNNVANDGLTYHERNNMVKVSNSAYCNIHQGYKDNPGAEDIVIKNESEFNHFKDAKKKTSAYLAEHKKMQKAAKAKLKIIRELSAGKNGENSIEFERMKLSIEKLAKLSDDATPAQTTQALESVARYSDLYKKKIDRGMGGFWHNGDMRRRFSDELEAFANVTFTALNQKQGAYINYNEPIGAQVQTAKANYDRAYAKVVIDPKAKFEELSKSELLNSNDNAVVEDVLAQAVTLAVLEKQIETTEEEERIANAQPKNPKPSKKSSKKSADVPKDDAPKNKDDSLKSLHREDVKHRFFVNLAEKTKNSRVFKLFVEQKKEEIIDCLKSNNIKLMNSKFVLHQSFTKIVDDLDHKIEENNRKIEERKSKASQMNKNDKGNVVKNNNNATGRKSTNIKKGGNGRTSILG